MRLAAHIRRFSILFLVWGALATGGNCIDSGVYNPGDPASEEYYLQAFLRCALFDAEICPVVNQSQPDALSNLKLWLEADVLSQGDDTPVTSWTDKSTSGFNATQGTVLEQPTYKTGVIGGQPAVRFDAGADPGNNLILGANYLFSTNDGMTIMAVVRGNAQDDPQDYILDFGKNGDIGYGLAYSANSDGVASNARLYVATGAGGGAIFASTESATTDVVLLTARVKFAPASDKHISLYKNGGLLVTDTGHNLTQLTASEINEATTRSTDSGPVVIGGQSKSNIATDRFFDGDIALVLVFNKALTESERQGLECYAALKYSITVSQTCI